MRRYRSLQSRKPWRSKPGESSAREKQERADAAKVRARAKGRCEVHVGPLRCQRPDVDTHHVIKRSAGGRYLGTDYLLRVCRPCHSLFDQHPEAKSLIGGRWVRGQLKAVALGGGRFRCWLETSVKHSSVSRGNTTGASGEKIPATGGA